MLPHLPALSVRQPWATSILNGKPVENRIWDGAYLKAQLGILERAGNRFLLHGSKGLTPDECGEWREFVNENIPAAELEWTKGGLRFIDLPRGGIIGVVTCGGWVTQHPSPWFTGPGALVISKIEPVPFTPCRGNRGFFWPEIPKTAARHAALGGADASGGPGHDLTLG